MFLLAVFLYFGRALQFLLSMASLDMSLDDMIKNRRNNDKGGRRQGRVRRGRGPGGSSRGGRPFGAPRRNPLGVNARPSPYTIAKASSKLWMSYALHRQICYDVVPHMKVL